jgi:hypothetical protein
VSATLDEVMAALVELRTECRERFTSLEQSVDGLDRYMRDVIRAEQNDTDHAEQREADALDIAAELEAEQVAQMESHERKAKGGE